MKVIVVSGGFDPIHSGHIYYLSAAKKLGDKLIVALNSDDWLINKKGYSFMPFSERKIIDAIVTKIGPPKVSDTTSANGNSLNPKNKAIIAKAPQIALNACKPGLLVL